MLIGFLLINKKNFEFKEHLKKTLKIFKLLIFWSLILTIVIKLIQNQKISIIDIIKNIFTTDIYNEYTGILWFLQNLIALYLIYPMIKITHDSNKKVYNYICIVLLINTVLVNFLSLISNLIQTQVSFKYINIVIDYISKFQILTNRNFLIFFMLGGYLYENKDKFEDRKFRIKCIAMGVISWIVSFGYAFLMSKLQKKTYVDSFNYNSVFILLIVIGLFALTYRYKDENRWDNVLIKYISKNSLGIYLLHIIIIRIINRFYIGEMTILFRLGKVLIVLFASLGLTLIIKKIPKVRNWIEI